MKKVSEEHLLEIQTLRNELFQIISGVGELHLNKVLVTKQLDEINSNIENLENKFAEFQQNEMVLYKKLEDAYGSGSINFETGEITE